MCLRAYIHNLNLTRLTENAVRFQSPYIFLRTGRRRWQERRWRRRKCQNEKTIFILCLFAFFSQEIHKRTFLGLHLNLGTTRTQKLANKQVENDCFALPWAMERSRFAVKTIRKWKWTDEHMYKEEEATWKENDVIEILFFFVPFYIRFFLLCTH